jgi:hypothetical protein
MDQVIYAGGRAVKDGPAEFYTVQVIRFNPLVAALVTIVDHKTADDRTVDFGSWDGGGNGGLAGTAIGI